MCAPKGQLHVAWEALCISLQYQLAVPFYTWESVQEGAWQRYTEPPTVKPCIHSCTATTYGHMYHQDGGHEQAGRDSEETLCAPFRFPLQQSPLPFNSENRLTRNTILYYHRGMFKKKQTKGTNHFLSNSLDAIREHTF